jgi:putative ABC transport system permease protein
LKHRKSRVVVACLAVALGVCLPATVIGLRGVEGKFERELQAYGANLLIVPRSGSSLDEGSLALLDRMIADGRLEAYVPVLSLVARVGDQEVALAGTRFAQAREFFRWWEIEGAWPQGASAALLGANVAAKLGQGAGGALSVRARDAAVSLAVAGVVRTGGSEENQIFMDLGAAQALAGRRGRLSVIQGRARQSRELAAVTQALAEAIPDAEVRTPFQVVKAEEMILRRLQRLLLLVTGVVLGASVLGVFATMAASALERRQEVGVMKALGADEQQVVRLFAAEAIGIGLTGGILGFGLGLLLAEAIAWRVFGAFVLPSLPALLLSLAVGLGVSLGASAGPVRRVARVAPAAVLKGA